MRARRLSLAVLAALAGAAAVAGCQADLAPVSAQGAASCLQAPGRLRAQQIRPPAVLRPLADARGATRVVAVWRREQGPARAFAYIVVFTGTERAEAAPTSLGGLRTSRRQNVVTAFGRSGTLGRAPRGGEERQVKDCLRSATS